jgi:hypothetical protein
MTDSFLRVTPSDFLMQFQSEPPDLLLPQIISLLCDEASADIPHDWIENNISSIQKPIKDLPISATLMVKDSFFGLVIGCTHLLHMKGISDEYNKKLTEYIWQKIRADYYS